MEPSSSEPSTAPSVERLIDALSQPPASFKWSSGHDRRIGTREGFAIDVWPNKVVCAAVMAFDRPKLAQNNAQLLLLVLTALRPDWSGAGDWLAQQMRQAKSALATYTGPNYARQVVFEYHPRGARVTLTIKVQPDGRSDPRGA